jgi:CRISPR/Cas system-associated exonuclease Cas4 (RecB family)
MTLKTEDMKRLLNSPHRLLAPVERLLLEQNAKNNEERDSLHLHPSEICKKDWCPRSSWYKITGYPGPSESFSLQRLNIFAEGHLIHEKWQKWLKQAGVLLEAEVPIKDVEHHIIGHADGIISDKHGKAVLEIKSLGVGTVRMEDYALFAPYARGDINIDALWASIKKPFPSHVRQTQLYMHCLGIHEALILYEWKANQDVKEFTIHYQPDIVDSILASCHTVVRALEDNEPPVRPSWLDQAHRVCKSCPYKKQCYNNEDSSDNRQSTDSSQGRGWGPSPKPSEHISSEVSAPRSPDRYDSESSREPRRINR